MAFHVYILLSADGSYYVGHASDLARRLEAHQLGRGARFTSLRRPVRLVYAEELGSEAEAVAREMQVKGWTRAKKQALIAGASEALHKLSKRRGP